MTMNRFLAELGERVQERSPSDYHLLLQHVATLIADTAPGTAAALGDASAPDIVRQRALATASAALLRGNLGAFTACDIRLLPEPQPQPARPPELSRPVRRRTLGPGKPRHTSVDRPSRRRSAS